jgi:hypothetical protein
MTMLTDKQVNDLFYWCVHILERQAKALGITYEAINVWIFCIIEPLALLALVAATVLLYRKNKRLRSQLSQLR